MDVLEYLYTGEVQIVEETAIDLVKAGTVAFMSSCGLL